MKSNYDRSKSISRKTTKNYHPRADDPRLLKLCRHVSTVQYSSTVQYLQTCQYGHVRHFSRGETVLRLKQFCTRFTQPLWVIPAENGPNYAGITR